MLYEAVIKDGPWTLQAPVIKVPTQKGSIYIRMSNHQQCTPLSLEPMREKRKEQHDAQFQAIARKWGMK